MTLAETNRTQIAGEPSVIAHDAQCLVVAPTQPIICARAQSARQQTAADTSHAESRRLLRRELNQFDGSLRSKPRALQRPNRLKAAQHTNHAVKFPGVRNRVDMRPCRHGGHFWMRTFPLEESVAYRVLTNCQPRLRAACFQPGARSQVLFREDNAGHGRRLRIGELRKLLDLARQLPAVDVNLHRSPRGWRFQSL